MTATKDDYYHGGLTDEEVLQSREKHGTNLLTPPKRPSVWKLYLEKFEDPVVRVLLFAAILSFVISVIENEYAETIGIIAAILLATGIGFYFEYDAGRKFDLLNAVNEETQVKVIRNGRVQEIARKNVVVGDIVVLETGEEIPADGELLEAISLQVNESNLTGEPVVDKTVVEADFDHEATYASNRVMRGTTVVDGHGTMRVLAVGDETEIGKVARQSTEQNVEPTPLNIQLTKLADLIGKIGFTVAGLAFAVFFVKDVLLHYEFSSFHTFADWLPALKAVLQYFMMAVTLIVVAVPEGLPMSVTLSLALNMRRMLSTNNLVRKMHACETMGSTTVICTDKTGTLTQNQMQVYKAEFYGDVPRDIIYEGIAVNSTAQLDLSGERPQVLGNPTEGALLLWLHDNGQDYGNLRGGVELIEELPFSTERKYMATVVKRADGKRMLYVKGAPEIVFGLCADSGIDREKLDKTLSGYQNMAMRTLGFACQELEPGDRTIADGRLVADRLRFIGIVAISDPVRPDVPDAVREVMDAGIKVKIVTGDTVGTAKEIARQIGLWDDSSDSDRNIITGAEFGELSDDELTERVADLKIIARARPLDKKRLVEALQRRDEVVAVTGDGTNDAPALKAAHVGLSMGDGTSVAKEASDITIVDNSFASIGRAVMWGRSLYKNIQRFILFQLTVNVVACLIVLCGAFMNTQSPLTVTQMLWVNLIMDTFAAMALASLPPDRSVMRDKPRRSSDFIITKAMALNILVTGGLFFVFLLCLLICLEHTSITSLSILGNIEWVGFKGLSAYELSVFFSFFVFLQFWNMFNARAFQTGRSAFHLHDCGGFISIALAIFIGQIAIVEFGGPFFSVTPIAFYDWIIIICFTSLVLIIGELFRLSGKQERIKR